MHTTGPALLLALLAMSLTSCVPRKTGWTPVDTGAIPVPGSGCAVDLVNDTGDLVMVWYDPGNVQLGLLDRHEAIEFEADCSHRVLRIQGRRHNAVARATIGVCTSVEVQLKPGKIVMVSLPKPRVPSC